MKSILLVDDNPNDVELTLAALQADGISNPVVVTRDGAEALDYLRRQGIFATRLAGNPIFILLDIKMPKLDGLGVLRQIRMDEALKYIPVVILTASIEERDIIESYQLGVNGYVKKPVTFEQFIEAVKAVRLFWAVVNEPPLDQ